jgi:hypothetical protein
MGGVYHHPRISHRRIDETFLMMAIDVRAISVLLLFRNPGRKKYPEMPRIRKKAIKKESFGRLVMNGSIGRPD